MKTVREVIRRAPVWVNPGHTTESAIVLMRGHDIGALPVMEGSSGLVGMVFYSHLLGVDPRRQVEDVMMVDIPTITPQMSVREAAEVMTQTALSRLPVMEGEKLVGVVTDGDLLPELGRSFDPLTELPWSDSLREWTITQLKRGQEVTVLFIDLDRFGQFNKLYGHIIGDEVLQSVANALRAAIDSETDFLCRYGGDEFCIATLRPADEAEDLAARLSRRVGEIAIHSVPDERVTCAIGQFGGKRTKEREHTHYAATVNSLINLASRDCTAHKTPASALAVISGAAAACRTTPRLRLARIDVSWKSRIAHVKVDLEMRPADSDMQETLRLKDLTHFPAESSAKTDESGVIQLVAETTANALRGVLPTGYDVAISDVLVHQTTTGQDLITVVGRFTTEKETMPIAGSALVADDIHRAAASAVLAAVNRPLGKVLAGSG